MIKPAIVAVGYNRPESMRKLLISVENAQYDVDDVTLIVSIDESNLSDEVEKVVKNIPWSHGKKIIRRFPERQGLRKHIVSCGNLSKEYGAVIILEDDLIVSKNFYNYTCQAQEFYKNDHRICGVSLYSFAMNQFTNTGFSPRLKEYDTYLGGMVVTWGQSWTKEQWQSFLEWYEDHEDKLPETNMLIPDEISNWNRSWGKYFVSYMAEYNKFYVYPYHAHSTCFAEIGEHLSKPVAITSVQVPLSVESDKKYIFPTFEKAVKYDSFYERIFDDEEINQIKLSEVCIDLNGMKKDTNGKKYLITCQKQDYKLLQSFALNIRPIEMNILYRTPGDDFFLYKLENGNTKIVADKKKDYNYKLSLNRYRYEHYKMSWRSILRYLILEIKEAIKTKFR